MSDYVASSGPSSGGPANIDNGQETATSAIYDSSAKDVRIWMDGAFDMMHFGHMNAFRLGKALGRVSIKCCFENHCT